MGREFLGNCNHKLEDGRRMCIGRVILVPVSLLVAIFQNVYSILD
jgi:hypothetical protein